MRDNRAKSRRDAMLASQIYVKLHNVTAGSLLDKWPMTARYLEAFADAQTHATLRSQEQYDFIVERVRQARELLRSLHAKPKFDVSNSRIVAEYTQMCTILDDAEKFTAPIVEQFDAIIEQLTPLQARLTAATQAIDHMADRVRDCTGLRKAEAALRSRLQAVHTTAQSREFDRARVLLEHAQQDMAKLEQYIDQFDELLAANTAQLIAIQERLDRIQQVLRDELRIVLDRSPSLKKAPDDDPFRLLGLRITGLHLVVGPLLRVAHELTCDPVSLARRVADLDSELRRLTAGVHLVVTRGRLQRNADSAGTRQFALAESCLEKISDSFRADPFCVYVSQVLRLPLLINDVHRQQHGPGAHSINIRPTAPAEIVRNRVWLAIADVIETMHRESPQTALPIERNFRQYAEDRLQQAIADLKTVRDTCAGNDYVFMDAIAQAIDVSSKITITSETPPEDILTDARHCEQKLQDAIMELRLAEEN